MDAAQITLITGVLITICISICLIFSYCRNPFDLPELIIHIDISGKRQPVYEEYVDMWINDLSNHKQDINKQCELLGNKLPSFLLQPLLLG